MPSLPMSFACLKRFSDNPAKRLSKPTGISVLTLMMIGTQLVLPILQKALLLIDCKNILGAFDPLHLTQSCIRHCRWNPRREFRLNAANRVIMRVSNLNDISIPPARVDGIRCLRLQQSRACRSIQKPAAAPMKRFPSALMRINKLLSLVANP